VNGNGVVMVMVRQVTEVNVSSDDFQKRSLHPHLGFVDSHPIIVLFYPHLPTYRDTFSSFCLFICSMSSNGTACVPDRRSSSHERHRHHGRGAYGGYFNMVMVMMVIYLYMGIGVMSSNNCQLGGGLQAPSSPSIP
jgi:hypothetical protein